MKNRPSLGTREAYKIKRVRELRKQGDYLKEEFHESDISKGTDSVYGYKDFVIPDDYTGYDRGLYETLKGDASMAHFATFCRELELGEFKNGKLDGYGARYLYDGFGCEHDSCTRIGIFGKFHDGLPNRKMLYYSKMDNATLTDCYALTHFFYGKLLTFEENYHDDKIDIQDQIFESIFYAPQFSREYKSKEWWEDYKNEFS